MSEVTLPIAAEHLAASAMAKEVPHRWMKPFEVDWMLHAIRKAWSGNAAHAALCVWMHKDQLEELTDELLDELKKGGELARE